MRSAAPPTQADASGPASGTPASLAVPSEYSQYCPAAQSLESTHVAPGVTHAWNEHTCPAAQQALPHADFDAQHVPPAQTPPSPHAAPLMHALTSANEGTSAPLPSDAVPSPEVPSPVDPSPCGPAKPPLPFPQAGANARPAAAMLARPTTTREGRILEE